MNEVLERQINSDYFPKHRSRIYLCDGNRFCFLRSGNLNSKCYLDGLRELQRADIRHALGIRSTCVNCRGINEAANRNRY